MLALFCLQFKKKMRQCTILLTLECYSSNFLSQCKLWQCIIVGYCLREPQQKMFIWVLDPATNKHTHKISLTFEGIGNMQ